MQNWAEMGQVIEIVVHNTRVAMATSQLHTMVPFLSSLSFNFLYKYQTNH